MWPKAGSYISCKICKCVSSFSRVFSAPDPGRFTAQLCTPHPKGGKKRQKVESPAGIYLDHWISDEDWDGRFGWKRGMPKFLFYSGCWYCTAALQFEVFGLWFHRGCDHQQWITITDGSAVPRQTAQVEAKEGSSAEIHRGEKVLAMAGEPRDLGMVGTCCGNEMEGTWGHY